MLNQTHPLDSLEQSSEFYWFNIAYLRYFESLKQKHLQEQDRYRHEQQSFFSVWNTMLRHRETKHSSWSTACSLRKDKQTCELSPRSNRVKLHESSIQCQWSQWYQTCNNIHLHDKTDEILARFEQLTNKQSMQQYIDTPEKIQSDLLVPVRGHLMDLLMELNTEVSLLQSDPEMFQPDIEYIFSSFLNNLSMDKLVLYFSFFYRLSKILNGEEQGNSWVTWFSQRTNHIVQYVNQNSQFILDRAQFIIFSQQSYGTRFHLLNDLLNSLMENKVENKVKTVVNKDRHNGSDTHQNRINRPVLHNNILRKSTLRSPITWKTALLSLLLFSSEQWSTPAFGLPVTKQGTNYSSRQRGNDMNQFILPNTRAYQQFPNTSFDKTNDSVAIVHPSNDGVRSKIRLLNPDLDEQKVYDKLKHVYSSLEQNNQQRIVIQSTLENLSKKLQALFSEGKFALILHNVTKYVTRPIEFLFDVEEIGNQHHLQNIGRQLNQDQPHSQVYVVDTAIKKPDETAISIEILKDPAMYEQVYNMAYTEFNPGFDFTSKSLTDKLLENMRPYIATLLKNTRDSNGRYNREILSLARVILSIPQFINGLNDTYNELKLFQSGPARDAYALNRDVFNVETSNLLYKEFKKAFNINPDWLPSSNDQDREDWDQYIGNLNALGKNKMFFDTVISAINHNHNITELVKDAQKELAIQTKVNEYLEKRVSKLESKLDQNDSKPGFTGSGTGSAGIHIGEGYVVLLFAGIIGAVALVGTVIVNVCCKRIEPTARPSVSTLQLSGPSNESEESTKYKDRGLVRRGNGQLKDGQSRDGQSRRTRQSSDAIYTESIRTRQAEPYIPSYVSNHTQQQSFEQANMIRSRSSAPIQLFNRLSESKGRSLSRDNSVVFRQGQNQGQNQSTNDYQHDYRPVDERGIIPDVSTDHRNHRYNRYNLSSSVETDNYNTGLFKRQSDNHVNWINLNPRPIHQEDTPRVLSNLSPRLSRNISHSPIIPVTRR